MLVNTKKLNNYLDYLGYYNTASEFTEWITIVSLGFIPSEPGLDMVIFILFINGILTAFWAGI